MGKTYFHHTQYGIYRAIISNIGIFWNQLTCFNRWITQIDSGSYVRKNPIIYNYSIDSYAFSVSKLDTITFCLTYESINGWDPTFTKLILVPICEIYAEPKYSNYTISFSFWIECFNKFFKSFLYLPNTFQFFSYSDDNRRWFQWCFEAALHWILRDFIWNKEFSCFPAQCARHLVSCRQTY